MRPDTAPKHWVLPLLKRCGKKGAFVFGERSLPKTKNIHIDYG